MTRDMLVQYRSKNAEIKELEEKLQNLGDGKSMIGCDTVMDYSTGYPRPQTVVGVDWKKVFNIENKYRKRIEKLHKECLEVENFIESIENSLTRRIFRMHYVDGMTLKNVGKNVHLDKSNVSRRIENFLKVATHATNTVL